MKRLCLVLALLAGGVTHAWAVMVPLDDGNWVDSVTGKVYPGVGSNIAVNPRTGEAFVPGTERRRQAVQQDPASADCVVVKNPATDKYVMKCRQ